MDPLSLPVIRDQLRDRLHGERREMHVPVRLRGEFDTLAGIPAVRLRQHQQHRGRPRPPLQPQQQPRRRLVHVLQIVDRDQQRPLARQPVQRTAQRRDPILAVRRGQHFARQRRTGQQLVEHASVDVALVSRSRRGERQNAQLTGSRHHLVLYLCFAAGRSSADQYRVSGPRIAFDQQPFKEGHCFVWLGAAVLPQFTPIASSSTQRSSSCVYHGRSRP